MHLDGDDERLEIAFKRFQQDQPGERQTAQSVYPQHTTALVISTLSINQSINQNALIEIS